ncbi:hypothetical protein B0T22DRAFT_484316 [Podospora appendiculata]|uniref:Uncharacterized protein n=1 Tax=Podospora appendiculata TaxID=314037 RepID=A0AAE0X0N6_9PEZI|nr:hypothetical protein B0T22DRAFT_484316 [Podospora appendiculata]
MVKPATVAILLASALPSLTAAKKCTNGLIYCGYNLLRKGDYAEEMKAELARVGETVDWKHVYSSSFVCGAGGDGWIRFVNYCENGCHDGGAGHSDYC